MTNLIPKRYQLTAQTIQGTKRHLGRSIEPTPEDINTFAAYAAKELDCEILELEIKMVTSYRVE